MTIVAASPARRGIAQQESHSDRQAHIEANKHPGAERNFRPKPRLGALERPGRLQAPENRLPVSLVQRLAWPTRLPLGALLLAALMVASRPAANGAISPALSEVWSESEGLRMKYSTNHDDLLGSRGSELSLSTDKHEQRHGAQQDQASAGPGSGGESSSPSDGSTDEPDSAPAEKPAQAVESAEGADDERTGSEQGTESSSRLSEKLSPVAAGRVQSYSASNQHSFKSSHRAPGPALAATAPKASSASGSSSNENYDEDEASGGGGGGDEDARSPDKSAADFPESGAMAAADAEDMSGHNFAPDDRASGAGPGDTKFKQPSRRFKEAVRMAAAPSSKKGLKELDSDDEEPNGDDNDQSPAKDEKATDDETGPGRARTEGEDGDSEGAPRNQGDQDEGPARAGGQSASPFGGPGSLQNALHFDNYPGAPLKPMQSAEIGRSFGAGAPAAPFVVDHEDEPGALPGPRSPFYDNSVQSSRSALAASTPQKERVVAQQPTSGAQQVHQPRQQTRQQAAAGPGRAGSVNPQTYKQLSYFKSLPDHPAPGSRSQATRKPTLGSVRSSEEADSPDSVRDNFISPGHFPGSMPHLTQAASEIRQAGGSPQAESRAPQEELSSDASKTLASAPIVLGQQSSQRADDTGAKDSAPIAAAASEPSSQLQASPSGANRAGTIAVTPTPEAQPESQQIMAPDVLMSTTTMAPLPLASTSAAPSLSTTASTSTSTNPPSLKRFKFRKYR